ncbi:sensor histidine kinase [uncultured Roseobacter sp.]|uniref:sensor histidine kinase n=1 Tax=uncultured Roseobacter sp. TaxID=114847 RepID=UPI0026305A28|nr:sensor histidine kinase [uncultured Roseobacter sp.]
MGLANRGMLLVTLALLPLGLVALWQTDRIFQDNRASAEVALLAVTEKAAARERLIIERTIGAAMAMGNTASALLSEPERCAAVLGNFRASSQFYAFAGFIARDGQTTCIAAGSQGSQATTLAADETLRELADQQAPGLYTVPAADAGDPSLLVIAAPVFSDEVYRGHMTLHIARDKMQSTSDDLTGERPLGLVTFSSTGEILTSERQLANARKLLPADMNLADLANEDPYTFEAVSERGISRTYALLPMVPDAAYALGTWDNDTGLLQAETSYWRTIALAGLTWLASLLVVFLIMQVLVLNGMESLRIQFRRFRATRDLPTGPIRGRGELYDLEDDFRELAGTILQDEARLEDAVREKNVLLKEVHHRVKNNLQLINSIINMILRARHSDATKTVVRRLQDRVMAMASVHQSIYQAQSMERIDAAEIVREIVSQAVNIGLPRGSAVSVNTDLTPVVLHPDQAMPLSLLVSEAVTNALKYVGGDAPEIRVSLSGNTETDAGRTATLSVVNTVGPETDDGEGTGLGAHLVRAFSYQLEGDLVVTQQDGLNTVSITFNIAEYDPTLEKSVTIAA